MFVSITRTAAAAFIVGSALLISAPGARAGMSAQEKHQKALENCEQVMQGQRSFCMIQAQEQYRVDLAREQKKDITVHHDFDTSNDTPAQTKAKQGYQQAVEQCEQGSQGQRSFCMIDAHHKYRKGMNW